eukprot:3103103-Pleurochrysis_carterae.AAC.1
MPSHLCSPVSRTTPASGPSWSGSFYSSAPVHSPTSIPDSDRSMTSRAMVYAPWPSGDEGRKMAL